MKVFRYLLIFISVLSFAQKKEKKPVVNQAEKEIIRSGNDLYRKNNYQDAEIQYKKALELNPQYEKANYNLGNAIYQQDRFEEAVPMFDLVTKTTEDKTVRGENFHNIGNSMMKQKQYDKAIDAYKNALRNNPNDDETRYNLALAQKLRKQEADNRDDKKNNKDNQNKKDQNKEDQNKENQDQNKNKDKSDQGDKNKDQKGNDKDQSKNKDQNQQNKQQPQPNKLSPQQIKQLLEAMNNEENKTQKKVNAKKAKGRKVKQEKDW